MADTLEMLREAVDLLREVGGTPEVLKRRTPEELAAYPRLSREAIQAAIDQGARDRWAAENPTQPYPWGLSEEAGEACVPCKGSGKVCGHRDCPFGPGGYREGDAEEAGKHADCPTCNGTGRRPTQVADGATK